MMKIFPTLVTYKQAPKDAVNYIFQVTNVPAKKIIFLDEKNFTSKLPDWIPDTEIALTLEYKIDLANVSESCFLEKTDEIFLMVLISHQGTMRSEKFIFELTPDLSNQEIVSPLLVSKNLFSQKFFIDLILIVDPDLEVERNSMSATELASVLWKRSFEVELERTSALGDVRSDNLDGALWKFDFNIPSDSASWPQLEWNSCVKVVIDKSRRDIIFDSIDLKTIMFSELLMFLFSKILETPDGIEVVLSSEKPSTFISECRKHIEVSFGGSNLTTETIRLKWKSESQIIFQDLQRRSLKVLKSRAYNE